MAKPKVRTTQMSAGEKSDILEFLSKGKSVQQAALEFGRSPSTIFDFLKTLRPTTALAKATLLARTSEIVDKVLDKGDVDQLIDILSRPNVGVLEPIPVKGGGGGNVAVGIAVSVAPSSLAAVNETDFVGGQQRLAESVPGVSGTVKRITDGKVQYAEFYQGQDG